MYETNTLALLKQSFLSGLRQKEMKQLCIVIKKHYFNFPFNFFFQTSKHEEFL